MKGAPESSFTAEEYYNIIEGMKSTRKKTQRFLPPQEVSSFHVTSETASIACARRQVNEEDSL